MKWSGAFGRILLGGLAALPILVALLASIVWAADVPEPFEWREAGDEAPLQLFGENLLQALPEPHFILFRAAYVGLLEFPGSDFGRFAWLNVGLALAVCLLLLRLARGGAWPEASRRDEVVPAGRARVHPAIPFALAMAAFSPAFAADWLVGARLRLFLSPLLLLLALEVLNGSGPLRRRAIGAGLLGLVALFVDWTGLLVWVCLLPPLARQLAALERPARTRLLVGWFLAGNLGWLVCYRDFFARGGTTEVGLVGHLFEDPTATLAFFLRAAAPLPATTHAASAAVTGAALLGLLSLLLVALPFVGRERRPPELLGFLSLALFGLGSAAILTDRMFDAPADPQLLREAGWPVLLLPIGLLGALAKLLPGVARRVGPTFLVALGVVLLFDGAVSLRILESRHDRLRQAAAQMIHAELATGVMQAHPAPPLQPGALPVLKGRGLLAAIEPATSLLLSEIPARIPDSDSPPRIPRVEVYRRKLAGDARTLSRTDPPDLVLISAGDGDTERIVRIATPEIVAGRNARPWRADLEGLELAEGELVRIVGLFGEPRTLGLPGARMRVRGASLEPIVSEPSPPSPPTEREEGG